MHAASSEGDSDRPEALRERTGPDAAGDPELDHEGGVGEGDGGAGGTDDSGARIAASPRGSSCISR